MKLASLMTAGIVVPGRWLPGPLAAAASALQRSWQGKTAGGTIKMLPFTDIGDEQYSTYLRVA